MKYKILPEDIKLFDELKNKNLFINFASLYVPDGPFIEKMVCYKYLSDGSIYSGKIEKIFLTNNTLSTYNTYFEIKFSNKKIESHIFIPDICDIYEYNAKYKSFYATYDLYKEAQIENCNKENFYKTSTIICSQDETYEDIKNLLLQAKLL